MFAPGFSTAESVSRVSGRGVGLDVVKQSIETLGGSVTVASEPTLGGATFVLHLPVSLLSARGLLVRAGEAILALPLDSVRAVRRVGPGGLRSLADGAVLEEAGVPVRVVPLDLALGLGPGVASGSVVLLSRGEARLGVLVDEVLREEELVTKRLPWNLRRVRGVSGAVVLADGAVALTVDVAHLFDGGARAGVAGGATLDGHREDGPHRRILVVEDSRPLRVTLEKMLRAAAYEVTAAADGEDTWVALAAGRFDLVISDVQMPRLDGLGLTQRIRQSDVHRSLPVILVTSLGSAEDIKHGAAAGADEYLIKGQYTREALLGAVTRLCDA